MKMLTKAQTINMKKTIFWFASDTKTFTKINKFIPTTLKYHMLEDVSRKS